MPLPATAAAGRPAATRRREGQPIATIIIPAYNEEDGLRSVLEKLDAVIDEGYEVIVVDDGSVDSTRSVAESFPYRVISHATNQGKGAAMRSGVRAARADRVIFIDADDTYPVEAIPLVADKLHWADLVLGARDRGRGHIPPLNRFGNWLIASLLNLLYGFKAADPLTGLYGLDKSTFERMHLRSPGFAVEAEIALKAARMGLTVDQLPIAYQERLGESKLRAMRDGYRICRMIIGMLSMYNPTIAFLIPGALLFAVSTGLLAALTVTPITIGSLLFETNSLVSAAMLSLAGFQFLVFGAALHIYGLLHKYTKPDRLGRAFLRLLTSPLVPIAAMAALASAAALSAVSLGAWVGSDFGAFTATRTLFLGAYLAIWGLQAALSLTFLSALYADLQARAEAPDLQLPVFLAEDERVAG
jgi:hypothetical protein